MSDTTLVIGAGAAGAAIAARATEDPGRRVVLVEAGPDYEDPRALPKDLRDGRKNSIRAHDWGFVYQPTPVQPSILLPRGKVTGGSSAVNTCIALRGAPEDYDEWAKIGGAEWAWERCLPAFKRLERDLDVTSDLHGDDGPIPIRRARDEDLVPIQRAFFEAVESLGYRRCEDHNDPATTGYGPHPMNVIDGVRMSTATGYLAPARGRPNLTIVPRALVHRVIIEGKRARGVVIEREGRVETLTADRVILAAGSIGSPSILVRSGVGPKLVLDYLGVPVIADLPGVGQNLQDHPGALIALVPREGAASFEHPMIQTTMRYTAKGSAHFNDMQLQPLSFLQRSDLPLLFGIAAVVERSFGAGELVFTSRDPHVPPLIRPDLARHPEDLRRLTEGITLALRVAESAPVRAISYGVLWPAPGDLASEEAIAAWLPTACGSGYHPCGTTAMGSVVDGAGKVFGVDGLIVADAGIMPSIPRANTNLPSIMIGERFGAWLREGRL